MIPGVGFPVPPVAVVVTILKILVVVRSVHVVLNDRVHQLVSDTLHQANLDFLSGDCVAAH